MCELTEPDGTGRVLEIGSGSGYHAAVLSRLFEQVYSVERIAAFSKRAQAKVRALHVENVHFKIFDGSYGWNAVLRSPEHQQFVVNVGSNDNRCLPLADAPSPIVVRGHAGTQPDTAIEWNETDAVTADVRALGQATRHQTLDLANALVPVTVEQLGRHRVRYPRSCVADRNPLSPRCRSAISHPGRRPPVHDRRSHRCRLRALHHPHQYLHRSGARVRDASIIAVAERLGHDTIATLNHRDFAVVRPHTATPSNSSPDAALPMRERLDHAAKEGRGWPTSAEGADATESSRSVRRHSTRLLSRPIVQRVSPRLAGSA